MSLHEDLAQAGLSLTLMPSLTETGEGWWAFLSPIQGKREKMPDSLNMADAWAPKIDSALSLFRVRFEAAMMGLERHDSFDPLFKKDLEASHPEDYL